MLKALDERSRVVKSINMGESHDCACCHKQINLFDKTCRVAKCNHEFHASCAKNWLKRKNSCPSVFCQQKVFVRRSFGWCVDIGTD